jgi:hypothetical protein
MTETAAPFEGVTLTWNGTPYNVPANRRLKLIMSVESIIGAFELSQLSQGGNIPLARIAAAYGAALRFAGASVTDEDVYAGMFQGTTAEAVSTALFGLLALMLPPAAMLKNNGSAPQGNVEAPAVSPSGSVKRRTRRSSVAASSSPQSSGN